MIVELGVGAITIGAVLYGLWRLQKSKAELAVRAGERTKKTEESNR